MSDNIAIFLTVLASSCLGMYFYYNEHSEGSKDFKGLEGSTDLKDVDDDNDNDDNDQSYSEEPEEQQEEEPDIYFGKRIRQTKSKSKRNKKSTKKPVSSRKTYY